MSSPFTVSVPFDPRYRTLAGQVAGKYAESLGGSQTDIEGFATAISRAVDALAAESGADADVTLSFEAESGGVTVEVRCGARASHVRHLIPTAKR